PRRTSFRRFCVAAPRLPCSVLSPYTTLFRSEADGTFYAMYTGFNRDHFAAEGKPSQVLMIAESDDLIHWRKTDKSLVAPQEGYRSEGHTSELQSRFDLVCRLLRENKNSLHKP